MLAPGLFPDDEEGEDAGMKVSGREVTEWVFPLFEDKKVGGSEEKGRVGEGRGKERGKEEEARMKREREDVMERITAGMKGLDVQLEEQGVEYLVERLGGLRTS